MIRSALCLSLALGVAASLGAPAFAQSKAEKCDAIGEMTQTLAELRRKGTGETEAILATGEQYKDASADFLQLIPYLSSFVYGLKAADLRQDVGGAMSAQCKAA